MKEIWSAQEKLTERRTDGQRDDIIRPVFRREYKNYILTRVRGYGQSKVDGILICKKMFKNVFCTILNDALTCLSVSIYFGTSCNFCFLV